MWIRSNDSKLLNHFKCLYGNCVVLASFSRLSNDEFLLVQSSVLLFLFCFSFFLSKTSFRFVFFLAHLPSLKTFILTSQFSDTLAYMFSIYVSLRMKMCSMCVKKLIRKTCKIRTFLLLFNVQVFEHCVPVRPIAYFFFLSIYFVQAFTISATFLLSSEFFDTFKAWEKWKHYEAGNPIFLEWNQTKRAQTVKLFFIGSFVAGFTMEIKWKKSIAQFKTCEITFFFFNL